MTDPMAELHERIVQYGERLARVTLTIGAQDGGPRADYTFYDKGGRVLTAWNDWAVEDNARRVQAILRTWWPRVSWSGYGTHEYHVKGSRRAQPLAAVEALR